MSDPRVYFAAERTQLAWLRTGLTIMALGFVVARFGLFLTIIAAPRTAAGGDTPTHWQSGAIGIALVVLGAATILGSLYNHLQYIRTLPPDDVPKLPIPWLTVAMSLAIALVGICMAAYLAVT